MVTAAKITDPWHHAQSWPSYGHHWDFTYNKYYATYTIQNSDHSITLSVPIAETHHFPSPQAWLDKWAKSKEGRQRLKPAAQPEQPSLFDRLGRAGGDQLGKTNVEVLSDETQLDSLTDDELRDRLFLERKVERAFYEAGKALKEIRDRRLYRSTHQTFEEYCSDRFAFKRRHPYRLIDAADVVDNLIGTQLDDQDDETQMCPNGTQTEMRTIGTQNGDGEVSTNGTQNETLEMCPNGAQILPTTERQVRPLTNLEPDQQRQAWAKAVEKAGGKVPSGRIVKSIVDLLRERRPIPNNWRVGEVATIIVKDNPDLRGKGGCWAVITAINNFSCTVRLWDGEYLVKPEHLKSFPYAMTDKEQNFFLSLCDRLSKIYDPTMEETASAILSSLGKIDRPFLTPLEEQLLTVLESSKVTIKHSSVRIKQ